MPEGNKSAVNASEAIMSSKGRSSPPLIHEPTLPLWSQVKNTSGGVPALMAVRNLSPSWAWTMVSLALGIFSLIKAGNFSSQGFW